MNTNTAFDWTIALDGSHLPDRATIGGKAWSVARMRALGLRVPPAFVIPTGVCRRYLEEGRLPAELDARIDAGIAWLEEQSGRRFGGGPRPLLVSVRSGAPVSMPGMMDTVLNLGIDDATQKLLAQESGDAAFAADTRQRFESLYREIVLKEEGGAAAIPADIRVQLRSAIEAVFRSWNSRRARRYREHQGIDHAMGTAVTVQAMVFGNLDAASGTGVLFSRNPLSGEAEPYGEYLSRAQGEDVVSGRHTPVAVSALRESNPQAYGELMQAAQCLEAEAGDMQDIEFTVERGVLYLLQSRVGKRSPRAAVRIAVEMARAGRLSPQEALNRVTPEQARLLLKPQLAEGATAGADVIARGEAASPGVGAGRVVTSSEEAEACAARGEDCVLVRATTSPEDLHGMIAARAILTERGGSTSHAAVVSRALGRPCVVGCGDASVCGLAGEWVTVDGSTGTVYRGRLPVTEPSEEADADLRQLAQWAAEHGALPVQARTDDAGLPTFDCALEDCAAQIAALPAGATVCGSVFANDENAVRAALAAGVHTIFTRPVLPALLAAAQARLD